MLSDIKRDLSEQLGILDLKPASASAQRSSSIRRMSSASSTSPTSP